MTDENQSQNCQAGYAIDAEKIIFACEVALGSIRKIEKSLVALQSDIFEHIESLTVWMDRNKEYLASIDKNTGGASDNE